MIHHKVAKVTPNHPSIINWRNSITESQSDLHHRTLPITSSPRADSNQYPQKSQQSLNELILNRHYQKLDQLKVYQCGSTCNFSDSVGLVSQLEPLPLWGSLPTQPPAATPTCVPGRSCHPRNSKLTPQIN